MVKDKGISVKELQRRMNDPNHFVYQAIQKGNQMRKNLIDKYGITESTASALIQKASGYNPRDEDEAYAIIHKLLKGRM